MRGYQRIGFTFQTFFVPASHPHECFCVPFGSFTQAFTVRILAQAFEDGADSPGEPLFPFQLFSRGGIQSKEGGLCWKTDEKPVSVNVAQTRTWPSETVRIWYRALHARRGRRRVTRIRFGRFPDGFNIIFY